jgi:hypothetical protein
MFCKTKQSAALELPRFQRSCSMALRVGEVQEGRLDGMKDDV